LAGRNFEPFPRQVLIGSASSSTSYDSSAMDMAEYRSIAWTFQVMVAQLGLYTNPAVLYLQEAEDPQGPWVDLIPGGEAPLTGTTSDGEVIQRARWLRGRVTVLQGEAVVVWVCLSARTS
jgi:hypothetical protein